MVIEGPCNNEQSEYPTTSPALAIAQLLKCNSVWHRRRESPITTSNVRRSTAQETHVPMYIGLLVRAQTRRRERVDRFSHIGVSITYDRVLRLSSQLGETVMRQFHKAQVECPPKMRGDVSTTAAVDYINHNPISTTS